MQIETKMQREKFVLSQERDALAAKVEELSEEITKKDKEMAAISDHLQQVLFLHLNGFTVYFRLWKNVLQR